MYKVYDCTLLVLKNIVNSVITALLAFSRRNHYALGRHPRRALAHFSHPTKDVKRTHAQTPPPPPPPPGMGTHLGIGYIGMQYVGGWLVSFSNTSS